MLTSANPFYAARLAPRKHLPSRNRVRYAKLPAAPITGSPVPELTSLYHYAVAGDYGDRGYPGNCGGNLLRFFRPASVCDPMSGSGTCRDVCRELRIPCWSGDIHAGFDLCDPQNFHGEAKVLDKQMFDFVWLHPPYWRMKLYADDPRDLSRAPTLEAFLERYARAIAHCRYILNPGGKLAVLMGDYNDRNTGFIPLTHHTKNLAFQAGLRQSCTDIIRFSHGTGSSKKVYRSSFIPGLHDVCIVFEMQV